MKACPIRAAGSERHFGNRVFIEYLMSRILGR